MNGYLYMFCWLCAETPDWLHLTLHDSLAATVTGWCEFIRQVKDGNYLVKEALGQASVETR